MSFAENSLEPDKESDYDKLFRLCLSDDSEYDSKSVVQHLEALKKLKNEEKLKLKTFKFQQQQLNIFTSLKRVTGNSATMLTKSDVYETNAFNGLLSKPLDEHTLKAFELFLQETDCSVIDELVLYFRGNTGHFDSTTAFIQVLDKFKENEDQQKVKELYQIFTTYAGKGSNLEEMFEGASEVVFIDAANKNETLAYISAWHIMVRKGLIDELKEVEFEKLGLFKESISITSMIIDDKKIGDMCCKALHFAVKIEDEDLALELCKYLVEEVKVDINSLSMRTEDSEEGDSDGEDSTSEDEEEENEKCAKYRVVETALHICIKRKSYKLTEYLLSKGADKSLPWVECPLDNFAYSSMREVIEDIFDFTPNLQPKWIKDKEYKFKYEEEYKKFIEKPFDKRALISFKELVDFYLEDEGKEKHEQFLKLLE